MVGNAGKGRPKGVPNRLTAAQALVGDDESPVAFGLRIMRDTEQPIDIRLHGARIAAPYIHPKPMPHGEKVLLDIPDAVTAGDTIRASATVLRAVATGSVSVNVGRDLMAIVEGHRKSIELSDIEARIEALEAMQGHRK